MFIVCLCFVQNAESVIIMRKHHHYYTQKPPKRTPNYAIVVHVPQRCCVSESGMQKHELHTVLHLLWIDCCPLQVTHTAHHTQTKKWQRSFSTTFSQRISTIMKQEDEISQKFAQKNSFSILCSHFSSCVFDCCFHCVTGCSHAEIFQMRL